MLAVGAITGSLRDGPGEDEDRQEMLCLPQTPFR
jgi:hypothetical protein